MANILICTQCGHVGKSVYKKKGNIGIALILWLCGLVPGFIYSIWMSSGRTNVCSQCKNQTLIPVDSPNAKRVFESTGQNQSDYLKNVAEEKQKAVKAEKKRNIALVVGVSVFFLLLILIIAFSQ